MATPTWTPTTPADTFPKAHPITTSGTFRIYFFDLETRQELTGHPLNGMHMSAAGQMVSHQGRFVDGTRDAVEGAAFLGGKFRDVRVTAESFPGRKVCAKIWFPDWAPEWSILATGDGTRVHGKPERVGREWVA